MTYSKDHPDAAQRVKDAVLHSKSDLDSDVADGCIAACADGWDQLESEADEHTPPRMDTPMAGTGKRLVTVTLQSDPDGIEKLQQLFDESPPPNVPSDQKESAKSFIGCIALHNGDGGTDSSFRDYLETIAEI